MRQKEATTTKTNQDRTVTSDGVDQHNTPIPAPSPPLRSVEIIVELYILSFSFLSFLFLLNDPKKNRHLKTLA
jgi:hypothetical protein